ncbi:septal ring lytic transglycosylase RlpA family protein [Pedobacter polysacchareus]|nr:septal ring lytic transglycosylase RlpA family protein [Pedobacter polysacchareus]
MLSFTGISAGVDNTSGTIEADTTVRTKTGYATYYARKFEGRRTTSGHRYRASKMTAAHLSLPFGTMVKVTNLSNGKTVHVKVNDRGPHSKKYIIDLSAGAAKKLGFYSKGHSKVEISYQLESE